MNYTKIYESLIHGAKNRNTPEGYVETHHITPRCLGGGENENNLVKLTAREHYIAHQLLVKMHPQHYGIIYSALLLTRCGRGSGRMNNRYYEWVKIRFSEAQSVKMKEYIKSHGNPSTRDDVKLKRRDAWLGKNNPSFGKPNWDAIKAAADAIRGKPQTREHSNKIASSIKKWHSENPDKHPMKNPETLAKAVASRRVAYLKKKGLS